MTLALTPFNERAAAVQYICSSSQRSPMGRAIIGVLVAIGSIGLAAGFARAAEQNPWVQLKGERPALSLDQTIFAGRQTDNSAFRHDTDGRSDWIQSGTMATSEPNITVVITRHQEAKTIRYSVVKDLDDLAELKAIQKNFKPIYYELATRLGMLRGVVFEVNADGLLKQCVGFHKPGTSKVYIKGFVCSTDEQTVIPERVACLVDKLRFTQPEAEASTKLLLGIEPTAECGANRLEPKSRTDRPNVDGARERL
jgi:hypothetical protein